MDTIKRLVIASGGGGEEMNRQSIEDFLGSENTLYDITKMDICHYSFAQTHWMYNIKNEPLGKLRTCVIIMCQYRFIFG